MPNHCQDCGTMLRGNHNPVRCRPCNGRARQKNPERHRNYCACGKLKSRDAVQCQECVDSKRSEKQPQPCGPHCRDCGKKIIFEGRCYECATHKPRLLVPA